MERSQPRAFDAPARVAVRLSMDSSREAPRVVDLFSGAGGLSLGFHAAGSQIVAALDLDEQAGETFTKNFGQLQAASAPIALFGPHDGDISLTNLEVAALFDVAQQMRGEQQMQVAAVADLLDELDHAQAGGRVEPVGGLDGGSFNLF